MRVRRAQQILLVRAEISYEPGLGRQDKKEQFETDGKEALMQEKQV